MPLSEPGALASVSRPHREALANRPWDWFRAGAAWPPSAARPLRRCDPRSRRSSRASSARQAGAFGSVIDAASFHSAGGTGGRTCAATSEPSSSALRPEAAVPGGLGHLSLHTYASARPACSCHHSLHCPSSSATCFSASRIAASTAASNFHTTLVASLPR